VNAEETRKLGEIARVTALSDPAFARRLAAGPLAGKARRRRVLARVLLAPGALLLMAGLVAASTDLILTALCVLGLALIIYVAGHRLARRTNR
jgi:hypothetical protein